MLSRELTQAERDLAKSFRGHYFQKEKWKQRSPRWTHDHCNFCSAQIREKPMDGDYPEGYVTRFFAVQEQPQTYEGWIFEPAPTTDNHADFWVCPDCFSQFREVFGWLTLG
ncbi:MAG: hypothetical protein ABL967_18895 [Bryobacteraceae bacterium]